MKNIILLLAVNVFLFSCNQKNNESVKLSDDKDNNTNIDIEDIDYKFWSALGQGNYRRNRIDNKYRI